MSKKNKEFYDLINIISNDYDISDIDISLEMGKNSGYIAQIKSRIKSIEGFEVPQSLIDKLTLIKSFGLPKSNMAEESEAEQYITKRNNQKNTYKRKNVVPFYDNVDATATNTLMDMTPISAPAGTIDVGDLLHDSEAAIRIYGNSMLPNYPPGCVVGLVNITNSFIQPGEVYVIETTDGQRLLKRLFYKDDDPDSQSIACYSDNTMKFEGGSRAGKVAYPPFYIHKKDLLRLYIVTGVIKRNTNSIVINRSALKN